MTQTKVVIVHPKLYTPSNDALVNSFASDVIPVHYRENMTKDELVTLIGENSASLTHLAFLYHYPGYPSLPFFNDSIPSDIASEGTNDIKKERESTYNYFSDTVIDIIKTLRDLHQDPNPFILDILTCDLTSQLFKEEVQKIETDLKINIRYSVDKTGNPQSGANWVLESEDTIVNVQTTYFTDGVLEWNGVLATDISTAIKAGTYSAYITWNSGTSTYRVVQDFTWSTSSLPQSDPYIALGPNEIFDGAGYAINLTGFIGPWAGLFSTGGTSITNASIIRNLGILNGTTSIDVTSYGNGFLVKIRQRFFKVQNCYSTGAINSFGGGIVGGGSGENGECIITNCYSTGQIGGQNSGGITGNRAGSLSGKCYITNCYSTGQMSGFQTGGITGFTTALGGGECIITNCYSTGQISGGNSGGITANVSNDGTCTITNCYSTSIIPTGRYGIAISFGVCNVIASVCNGGPISSGATNTDCSTVLSDIDNKIYGVGESYGWDSSIWKIGNPVSSISNYALPILIAFQTLPWIIDNTDTNYYDMATDLAVFAAIPSNPTITSVIPGNQTLRVSFTAPTYDGGSPITDYEYSLNSDPFILAGTTTSPFTIYGLTNGTEYSVVIRAVNNTSDGAESNAETGTPSTTPNAPTITDITPGNQTLEITFTAPTDNGGSPITNYKYSLNSDPFILAGTTTSPFTIYSLTNGLLYSVVIRAVNSAGDGAESNADTGTPSTTPSAPTIIGITPGNQTLEITFTAPIDDGGSPITDYEYSLNGDPFISAGTTSSPFTISGLTNGLLYSVVIRAVNGVGGGAESNAVTGTPSTTPQVQIEIPNCNVCGANLDTSNPQVTLYTSSENTSRINDQTIRSFYDTQIRNIAAGKPSSTRAFFDSYSTFLKFKNGTLNYRR
jgi:hypothetical protein